MAKVKGPLFSVTAFGTVGDILTFRRTRGRPAVYIKPTPAYRDTASQLSQRASFASCVSYWWAQPDANRSWYNDAAVGVRLSGFVMYMQNCLGGCVSLPVPLEASYIITALVTSPPE